MTTTLISAPPSTLTFPFLADESTFAKFCEEQHSAWRNDVNPLGVYLSTEGSNFSTRRFGIEIEFNALVGVYAVEDRSGEYTELGDWLHKEGLLHNDRAMPYHSGVRQYHRWRYECDNTVSGGEVISPILDGNADSWKTITKVMRHIREMGGDGAEENCGGHISIDAPEFSEDEENEARLIEMIWKFEDVMFRLAANPWRGAREGSHLSTHRGFDYAHAFDNQDPYEPLCREMWLHHDKDAQRLEFRIFDGSLFPSLSQTWALIANAFVESALKEETSESLADMDYHPVGWHHQRGLDNDATDISRFVDLLFSRDEDKERVLTLFASNDWAS